MLPDLMRYGAATPEGESSIVVRNAFPEAPHSSAEQGYEKLFVNARLVLWRVNIHALVRERLHMADANTTWVNHYWWNRRRPGADEATGVYDSSFWDRYGELLVSF